MKYEIKHDINPNIFRGYDIRAIYGEDLDENVAYTIGLSFGSDIKKNGYKKCVIGYDNRSSSVALNEALITGILETGINVISLGLVTTPMYYYAQIKLNDGVNMMPGIMITASHNPKEYNGFKMSLNDFGNACGEMIQDFRRFTEKCEFESGKGTLETYDIRQEYLDLIKKSIYN